jgi:LDH2 family malate/lactate/ureidoglycolate dehydrogenase
MVGADSDSVSDVPVDARRLEQIVAEVLIKNGATDAQAARQAAILVEGDLRDQHSHGVRRLPVLVGRLRNGLIDPASEPDAHWASDAVLQVDGRRGFGPVVAFDAIEQIAARSQATGVALAAVRNSNHIGMLAPYIEHIAALGQIGVALTTSEALVHPWGGAKAMLGTNPIGIAVPTGGEPLVLDMSTASVSMGKVMDLAVKSATLPHGWAVDSSGAPTTDPHAAVSGGAISPFGGSKGYALGLAFEAMVGVLTDSAYGRDVRGTLDTEHPANKGDVFVAISLERLGLTSAQRLDAYLDEVRRSAAQPGETVTVPGDRARATRAERLARGIPLHPEVWAEIQELHAVGSHV